MSQTWSLPLSGSQALSASRTPINDGFEALRTLHSGASEPSSTVAYMLWADTTTNLLKQRNAADDGWITVAVLNDTANWGLLRVDGTSAMTGALDLDGQDLVVDTDGDLIVDESADDTLRITLGAAGQVILLDGPNDLIDLSDMLLKDPQNAANTNTPSGATSHQIEVDIGGATVFVPAYASAW